MAYNTDKRVLIVDDSATRIRIIHNILRRLRFNNCVEAADGTTAWDVINSDKIDIIISG